MSMWYNVDNEDIDLHDDGTINIRLEPDDSGNNYLELKGDNILHIVKLYLNLTKEE